MTKAPRKAPQVPGEQPEQEPDTRGAGLDLDSLGEGDGAPEAPDSEVQAEAAVNTESDVDEAIALAQTGQARPIIKPRAPVAPARLTRPDPSRPPAAAVNQAPVMSYDDAMAGVKDGSVQRSVLTEQGWVAVAKAPPPETKR